MTTALDGHIEVDPNDVARIAGTRLKVIQLVMDKMAHGSSPEEMREQFPPLSLSQIYAALTYYHDHKAALDAQIENDLEEADSHRARAATQPSREHFTHQAALLPNARVGRDEQP